LASGIRAAEWALTELCARSHDEELVAVVETDMCGVDAIQYLTGCTFGKGNLIHKDYGKNAFTYGIPHPTSAGTDLVHTLL
jgi:formylmethanofuran dehydrogenase subunit E